jgi:predicted ATPase/DNA-binding CsgD family transcriptional regulator
MLRTPLLPVVGPAADGRDVQAGIVTWGGLGRDRFAVYDRFGWYAPFTVALATRPVGNLPADVTSFVGRRREVADVKKMLAGRRLVTLTGVGGVGKTRLALRAAGQVQRAFPGGVWLVELASLDDPRLVTLTVAATVGFRDEASVDKLAHRMKESFDQPHLLVLDNCEHVLGACAELVDTLLSTSPFLRVLATSRQPLGIMGESVLQVAPMSVPDEEEAEPGVLTQYEAVNLFVDRAAAVWPNFTVNHENAQSVARLCHRLDGVPLAIELAAVRLRALPVEGIVERLDDRFRLLSAGSRDAPPRQQTLQALIDWSFELCLPGEQMLWKRLSVFAEGFTLPAAEAVCSGAGITVEDVLHLLIGLVDKSVVIRDQHEDEQRYHLIETLRQYGRDRLEPAEVVPLGRRHRDYYRALAEQAEREWFGAGETGWLPRLRAEHKNLREALAFCAAQPGEAAAGFDIGASLRFFWLTAGLLNEGRHWLDRLLAQDTEATRSRMKALYVNSYLAVMLDDLSSSASLSRQAGELATAFGDEEGAAYVAQISGLAILFGGDLINGAALFEEALAGHRKIGDEAAIAYDLIELAVSAALLGDHERAMALLDECPAVSETYREHWMKSLALWAAGIVALLAGDLERAQAAERESMLLRRANHDRFLTGLSVEVLAWVAAAEGSSERAATLLGAAYGLLRSAGGSPAGLKHLVHLHDDCVKTTRAALGDAAFDRDFRHGAQLHLDEAVAWAMGEPEPGADGSEADIAETMLTRREQEIAELVAQGMSNKNIAAELVISQRTAESHVEHILNKLGFTSRSQIAAWVSQGRKGS